jgi:DNA polymerase elongation subunit (family B)
MKFKTDNKTVLDNPYINDVLIYDIETNSLDINSAKMVYFGAYSYKYRKYFICDYTDEISINKLLSEHRVTVGYNNKLFDGPIMSNNGYDMNYKIVFDCLQVLWNPELHKPNRKAIIQLKNGKHLDAVLKSHKLKDVAKALDLPIEKGDIDYRIFKKDLWSTQERKDIEHYLFKDVEITRLIFEFLVEYFDPFKDMISEDEVRKFNHIRTTTGSFTYSAICHAIGKPAEYPQGDRPKRPKYPGGFVLDPVYDYAENVIYFDFTSLYPSIEIMCNLFSPCVNGWKGGGFFETEGTYNDKEQGIIEKVLIKFFKTRQELKKRNDPKQLAYKIVLNTVYGISSIPIFINVFNNTVAKDTTSIGRQMIKFAIQTFSSNGFEVIGADTDSCFVKLGDKTKESAIMVADSITETIKQNVPFPYDGFKFKIDEEIHKIWYPGQKKKHYAYIDKNGKFKVTGLEFIKGDASLLGQKMVKYLKPIIEERGDCKFSKDYLKNKAMEFIYQDISLVGRLYKVKDFSSYKSTTSIQAQISKKYGEGEYLLVPNNKLGEFGKAKKYATENQISELDFDDIILDKFWTEMEVFTKDYISPEDERKLARIEEKLANMKQQELEEYFTSDLFDSESVGSDISNEEFLENDIFFEKNDL